MSKGELYEIMSGLYKYDDYVMANEAAFTQLPLNRIVFTNDSISITDKNKLNEFMQCLREDTLNLDYGEIKIDMPHWRVHTELAFEAENRDDMYAYTDMSVPYESEENIILTHRNIKINANYTKSIQWLKDNGYNSAFSKGNIPSYIAKIPDDSADFKDENYENRVIENTMAVADTVEKMTKVYEYLSAMKINSADKDKYTYGIIYDDNSSYDCNIYLTKEQAEEISILIN